MPTPHPLRPNHLIPLALAAVLLTGCVGTSALRSESDYRADRVLAEIEAWKGTPYRYGGDDRSGIDCSAFVQRIYSDALGLKVPRTTVSQRRIGHDVTAAELAFGDLVFFRTPERTNHVGIYIGDGRFAHASSSQGVGVSGLDEDYWRESYRSARRPSANLAETTRAIELPTTPRPPPAAETDRRTGW